MTIVKDHPESMLSTKIKVSLLPKINWRPYVFPLTSKERYVNRLIKMEEKGSSETLYSKLLVLIYETGFSGSINLKIHLYMSDFDFKPP